MIRRLVLSLLLTSLCLAASAFATVVTPTSGVDAGAVPSGPMGPLTERHAPLSVSDADPLAPGVDTAQAASPATARRANDVQAAQNDLAMDPSPLALLGLGLLTIVVIRRRASPR